MNMYFAVDKLASNFIENLAESFRFAISKNSELSIYALIDASFEYAQHRPQRFSWKSQATAIYDGTAFDELKDASPYLLPLSADLVIMRHELRKIFKVSSGVPMVSFIASSLSTSELCDVFKPFLEISVDDEQSFLLRFSDTRVLPVLDAILCKENITGWRRGIAHWWMPDRAGKIFSLPDYENNERIFNPEKNSLSLPQLSFNLLIEAGECDAILDAISDQNPDLLNDRLPSFNYALAHEMKSKIKKFRIENFPDVVMFCTTALATSEHFHTHPDFNAVLKSAAWRPGALGEAFSAIDDASWAAIESMSSLKI